MNELVSSTRSLSIGNEAEATAAADAPFDEEEESQEKEFVNTGLQRWEEIRHQWLAAASSASCPYYSSSSNNSTSSSSTVPAAHPPQHTQKPKRHAKDIDIDEVIDLIVSNRWRQQAPQPSKNASSSSLDTAKSATKRRDDACFPDPVALPQMIDVLIDLWEAEGLDI